MAREWEGLEQALESVCTAQAEGVAHRENSSERRQRIERLKRQVKAGEYRPDLKDIARLLTSAMDPTL